MIQLEQILSKYNFVKRVKKTPTTIEQIETLIKFKLPDDYIEYIQHYLGFEGEIGKEYVRIWDLDELIGANKNYAVLDNLPMTIAIGGNGGGEFIAIELADDNYKIVLSPFIYLDKRSHIEIGTSFTNMLVRLDKGKEWFK